MYMIIGAAGYLGSYFMDELLKTTNEKIVAVDLEKKASMGEQVVWEKCNIANFADVANLNKKYKSEAKKILFCSACHNPDYVEKHFDEAWMINIVSLANFLAEFENIEFFVYPSTDSVYGNSVEGFKFAEDSILTPVNSYGKQKELAEKIVTIYGYNVVRLPFMIGASLAPDKQHFFDTIVSTLLSGGTIEMFADSFRSTLSFRQVARFIKQLMEKGKRVPQIINICSDKGMSKYDVGLTIADHLGVSKELIKPIYLKDNCGIFQAQRASSTLMDNSLAKKVFGVDTIPFDVDLCFKSTK